MKPQVDDAGYDLVVEANGVIRHIQRKSLFRELLSEEEIDQLWAWVEAVRGSGP
jgi:hypothetical protein